MTILIILVVIISLIAVAYSAYIHNSKPSNHSTFDPDAYKNIDINTPNVKKMQPVNSHDIDNSYAFADRLKNIIFSRHIDETQLLHDLEISNDELKKYKFSRGLPPDYIIQKFSAYFNVSFKYLADCHDDRITVYDNGKLLYTKTYIHPHKSRFDNVGNCIFLDGRNSETLYHLNSVGDEIGRFANFSSVKMNYLKISDNGSFALSVSENNKVFFFDLTENIILWNKFLKFSNYNIKDITDNELVFRFRASDPPIDFSLDYAGNPFNFKNITQYFVDATPPVRYHSDGYILIINELLKDFENNKDSIIKLFSRMITSAGIKYFSTKKVASISKDIGIRFYEMGEYQNAYDYLIKATVYNPNIGIKTYLNKVKKYIDVIE